MMKKNTSETALIACFRGMSDAGLHSELAVLEGNQQLPSEKANIFCLGGLPPTAPMVLEKSALLSASSRLTDAHSPARKRTLNRRVFS